MKTIKTEPSYAGLTFREQMTKYFTEAGKIPEGVELPEAAENLKGRFEPHRGLLKRKGVKIAAGAAAIGVTGVIAYKVYKKTEEKERQTQEKPPITPKPTSAKPVETKVNPQEVLNTPYNGTGNTGTIAGRIGEIPLAQGINTFEFDVTV